MMLRNRKLLRNEHQVSTLKKKKGKSKTNRLYKNSLTKTSSANEIKTPETDNSSKQHGCLKSSTTVGRIPLSDNEQMSLVVDRSVREYQGGKLSVTLTNVETPTNDNSSDTLLQNVDRKNDVAHGLILSPSAYSGESIANTPMRRVDTPVTSKREVKLTSRPIAYNFLTTESFKGKLNSKRKRKRTSIASTALKIQQSVKSETLNSSDVVILDSPVSNETIKNNIKRLSAEINTVETGLKRKRSEDEIEVVFDRCEEPVVKKWRSSETIEKTGDGLSSNQKLQSSSITDGDNGDDDIIALSESDDEVLVVDTEEKLNSSKSDVIVLDSPPILQVHTKKKMVLPTSKSVSSLIPHYERSLTDFIPFQTSSNKHEIPHTSSRKNRKRFRNRGATRNPRGAFHGVGFVGAPIGKDAFPRIVTGNNPRFQNYPPTGLPHKPPAGSHFTGSKITAAVPAVSDSCLASRVPASSNPCNTSATSSNQTTTKVTQSPASSFGNNIYNPNESKKPNTGLRPVIIDGSNVALGHTNGKYFSWNGLHICMKYFLKRGHKVMAFVPTFRRGHCPQDFKSQLEIYEKEGQIVFTPSRKVAGRLIVPYDDRYIVQCAAELGGVIVSTDNYRDLLTENENWKETIETRLLMFTWAGDLLMFPHDPLGRSGPNLEDFLAFPNDSSTVEVK